MNKKKPLQFVLKKKSLCITDEIFNFPSISLQTVFSLIACILFLGVLTTLTFRYIFFEYNKTMEPENALDIFLNPR